MKQVPEESIKSLVAKAKDGDGEAFGALYQYYYRPLYRFILLRLNNKEDAEDMTQTVFMKALESLERYVEHDQFHSWLYMIARNAVIDHYKKKRSIRMDDLEWLAIPDNGPDPADDAAARETREALIAALNQLKPAFRQVLEMRFLEELSVAEIAVHLRLTEENVRQRQVRALRELREVYNSMYGKENE